ncbi:MAG: ABC transporter permease [Wenzhouxiangellaceae bacterium]|nr:ABC transporter permease [Wenzhouxiangellaceae bacterium]
MAESQSRDREAPSVTVDDGALRAEGDWTVGSAARLTERLRGMSEGIREIDGTAISRLDASGALLLLQAASRAGLDAGDVRVDESHRKLLETVAATGQRRQAPELPEARPWRELLERVGRSVHEVARSTGELLDFVGQVVHRLVRTAVRPSRLRLTSTVHHMEQTGLDAVPLLALLASLVGAVVAYLGATILREFGAELLVINLVTFSFLREFGVLLTAILLAGRTASAFCTQIGMMKSHEEIDAIRVLGLDVIELLVLPRLIALVVMLPLLAFVATISGLAGGMAVAVLALGIDAGVYVDQVRDSFTMTDYLVGLIKAPIFAFVIALIGCLEGLRVEGSAESAGRHTTTAVVRSLTMVIVIDALAAMYFSEIGW